MNKKTLTDLAGVYANGIHAGIKKKKKDLAFIYVPEAYSSVGVFTKNKFIAPCLEYSQIALRKAVLKAVIINSGNANAATGQEGFKNAEKTAKLAEDLLGLKPFEVAVTSTGIIGVQLPMDKIEAGVKKILKDPYAKNGPNAAEAILTTDLIPKSFYREKLIGGKKIVITGIAKGSGMIAPNMGTMLGFYVTNAKIEQEDLQEVLQKATDRSFNMVSVDTDTSTNDMVLLFSTGKEEINIQSALEKVEFQELLDTACIDLAKLIAVDGEGANHLIEVNVKGAASEQDAKKIALNVVNSPLVKCAVYGQDPNWGRVACAAGKDISVKVDPNKLEILFQDITVFAKGAPCKFSRSELSLALKQKEVNISLDLNLGQGTSIAWGCDLTEGYIKINTHYN